MSEFRVERIVTHQLYTTAKQKMEMGQQYCSWKECIHKKACPHVFNPIQEEKAAKAHCKYIFLVHWEGYTDDEWTWEPEVNLWLDGLMTIAIRRYKKDWPNVGFLPECELVWRERTWRDYPDAVLPLAEREGKDKRQFLFEGDLELIMLPEEKKQWEKELRRKKEKQKEARDKGAEKAKNRQKKREKEKRRESSYENTDSENELTIRRRDREAAEAAEKRRQQVGAEEKKRLDAQNALEAMERLLSKKNKEKRRSSGGSGKALDLDKDVEMAGKEESRKRKKDKLHPTPPISMEDIFGDDEAREKERQKRKEQKRKQKEREELERKQREKEERQKREEMRVMTEEEKQREKKEEEKREEMRREKEKARAKEKEKEKNLKKRAEEKKQEKAAEPHNPQMLTMLDLFGDMESTKKEKEKKEKERRKKKIREMKEKEERERKALEEKKKKKEAEEAWINLGSRSVEQDQSKETTEKTVMDVDMAEAADVAMAEPEEQAACVVESADTASMGGVRERKREEDGAAEEELEVRLRRMVVQQPYKDPFLYENVRNARRWNSCEMLCLFFRKPLRKERFNRLRAWISHRAARTVRALIRPNKNNLVVHFKKTVKNGASVLRAVDRDRAVLRQNRMRTTIPYEEIIQCEFARRAHAFGQSIVELQPLSEDGETRKWSHTLPVWFVAGHWDYASTFLCATEQRKEHRAAVVKVLVDMFAADAGYGWVLDEKEPELKKQHKPYACSSDHRKCRTLTAVLSRVAGKARFSEGGVFPPNAAHLALLSGAGTCVAIALIRAGCPLTGVDGSGHTIGHTAINKCSSNDLRRLLRAGVCMQSPLQVADRESRVRIVDWAKHKAKQTNNDNKRNRISQNVKLVRDVLSRMEVAWRNATDDVFPSFYAVTAEIGKARTLRVPEGDTHMQYEELLTIPQSAIEDYLKRETYSTVSLAVYCVDVRGGAKVRPRKRPENVVYTPFRVVQTQPDMNKWNGVVEASLEWEGVARFPLILRPCKRAGVWMAELPREEQKMLFSLRQRVSVRLRAHLPPGQLLVSNLCMVRSKRADKPIVV